MRSSGEKRLQADSKATMVVMSCVWLGPCKSAWHGMDMAIEVVQEARSNSKKSSRSRHVPRGSPHWWPGGIGDLPNLKAWAAITLI